MEFRCFVVIVLVLLLTTAEANEVIEPSEISMEHPGLCVWIRQERRSYHEVGESWKSGPCEETTCIRQNDQLHLQIKGCRTYSPDVYCGMTPIDASMPYPHCCPKRFCA